MNGFLVDLAYLYRLIDLLLSFFILQVGVSNLNHLIYKVVQLILLVVLSLGISSVMATTKITYKTVETKGSGENLQEAINNALVEAIGRVNGKGIDAVNQINKASKTVKTDGVKSTSRSKEIQQAYKEATNGIVASYDVLSEVEDDRGRWKVEVRAQIAQFKLAASANRKRIALVPFRLSDSPFLIRGLAADREQVGRVLAQSLVTKLVQSRRFTVLDREYMEETLGEKSSAFNNPNLPVAEIARLGQDLVADYIVVGTLENLSYSESTRRVESVDMNITTRRGVAEVSYRIIDITTGQIKFADTAQFSFDGDALSRVAGGGLANPDTAILSLASEKIGKVILNAIYPIMLVSIQNDTVTLNQGGDLLRFGDQYEVFEYGERLYDPYTKESIGRQENLVGTIQITRVNPKQSMARVLNSTVDLSARFKPKRFVCRLKEEAISPGAKRKQEARKRVKKKAKKAKEEMEELW